MLTDRFGVTWNPSGRMSVPLDAAQAALAEAMSAPYNPAQCDVMARRSSSRGPRTARAPRPDAPGRDTCPHG
jgi:hypothetical protein